METKKEPEVVDLPEEDAERVLAGGEPEENPNPMDKTTSDVPEWATIPTNVKLPKAGCTMAFIRVPAAWTSDPSKGDRWCAVWALSEADERLAYARARGDGHRAISELAKGCIKVIDGHKPDWSGKGGQGDVAEFWGGIGAKGRAMVRNYYLRTHSLSDEETLDFFANHFANVTVG